MMKFKKLDPRAVAPVRATKDSAGFDLTATRITTEINECGQLILVYHTDLALEIPNGYVGLLFPRSSIFKKSLRMCNSVGVIDSDYRGEVTAKFVSTTDVVPAVYKEGERFAQLVIVPVLVDEEFTESDTLADTVRGEGGYGSTGDSAIISAASPMPQEETHDQEATHIEEVSAIEQAAGDIITPEQV